MNIQQVNIIDEDLDEEIRELSEDELDEVSGGMRRRGIVAGGRRRNGVVDRPRGVVVRNRLRRNNPNDGNEGNEGNEGR